MNPEDVRTWLRREPFRPFRIHLSDGRQFEIRHPEFVLLLRSRLEIGLTEDGDGLIPNRVEDCSLIHIVSIEELDVPSGSNKPNS